MSVNISTHVSGCNNDEVPKIEAATVAEHHALRRTAIVDAAVDLLGRDGPDAVTPAAVAAAAGLARSSVYQYYSSAGALVAAAVESTFARTIEELGAAVSSASVPAQRISAYLDACLDAAVAGHLPAAAGYSRLDMPEQCHTRIAELHADLMRPLVTALREAGVPEPDGVAALVNGAVSAAAGQVRRGDDLRATRRRLQRFVLGAVGVSSDRAGRPAAR